MRILFFILLAFFTTTLHAQYTSRLGRFSVNYNKGCNPLTITVTQTPAYSAECTTSTPCLISFEGSLNQSDWVSYQNGKYTYTYTKTGTYTLTVYIQSIGQDDITIDVKDNVTPQFETTLCIEHGVALSITNNGYDQYIWNAGDGTAETTLTPPTLTDKHTYSFAGNYDVSVRGKYSNAADNCTASKQTITTTYDLPDGFISLLAMKSATSCDLTFNYQNHIKYRLETSVGNLYSFTPSTTNITPSPTTVTNLDATTYTCFRVVTSDVCNNETYNSNNICTTSFTATPKSGYNQLDWKTDEQNVASCDLTKNAASWNSLTLPPPVYTYRDSDIKCNQPNTYQLTLTYATNLEFGIARSVSLPVTLNNTLPVNNLTPLKNGTAFVSDNQLLLKWESPANATTTPVYIINRLVSDNTYAPFMRTTKNEALFTDFTGVSTPEFLIQYQDECQSLSKTGLKIVPIYASGKLTDANLVQLNWNAFVGFEKGVAYYQIAKKNQAGDVLETLQTSSLSFAETQLDVTHQTTQWTITAVPTETITVDNPASITITLERPVYVQAPTAFTPNQDGVNDTFALITRYVTQIDWMIFDRWGNVIFRSDASNKGWSGLYQDKSRILSNEYVWKANVIDQRGVESNHYGNVWVKDN